MTASSSSFRQAEARRRRIAVWGVTGAGKSTLARELGHRLGLPVIELDAIRHTPDWDSTPWPTFRSELLRRLDEAPEGWVLDGSYARAQDLYLHRIDTMIWLPLPLRVTLPRLFRRALQRSFAPHGAYGPGTARETLRRTFASRESLLLYALLTHRSVTRRRAARVAGLPDGVEVVELRSPLQVAAFLDHLSLEPPT